jgi:hypothetical protein
MVDLEGPQRSLYTNTLRLHPRDLRAIADGLEALAKLNVVVTSFRTTSGISCSVIRDEGNQMNPVEYLLTGIQPNASGGGGVIRD